MVPYVYAYMYNAVPECLLAQHQQLGFYDITLL